MQLKDIVCDIEYGEKLRKLGLHKESIFGFDRLGGLSYCDGFKIAYTVAELGEMLPDMKRFSNSEFYKYDNIHHCNYVGLDFYSEDKKEANARVKLLIWLIENNHVNVDELNEVK